MTHIRSAIIPDPDATLQSSVPPEWRLPRRDYILLPLIFVMTIVVLLIGGEVTARVLYAQDAMVTAGLVLNMSSPEIVYKQF